MRCLGTILQNFCRLKNGTIDPFRSHAYVYSRSIKRCKQMIPSLLQKYRAFQSMSLRKRCAAFVLLLSILLGLSPWRIYPFSNYTMFAYNRRNTMTYGLVLRKKDGTKMLLPRDYISPLTRLNLWQLGAATKEHPERSEWVQFLGRRAATQMPNIDSISLQEISILSNEDGTWSADLTSGQKIVEISL